MYVILSVECHLTGCICMVCTHIYIYIYIIFFPSLSIVFIFLYMIMLLLYIHDDEGKSNCVVWQYKAQCVFVCLSVCVCTLSAN